MTKDKASQEEIYRQMRQDIEVGSYPSSSRLPSVRTLARRFSASPNTISKVVSRLMESGLCSARRGVGLFVRSLPTRKLTVLVSSDQPKPGDDVYGWFETHIAKKLGSETIEVERFYITPEDPPYGPSVERIRKPGRVMILMGISHEPYLKQVYDLRRPMLVIGHMPNRCSCSCLVPNSFRSGYLAARHLIRLGKRNIAFIGRRRRVRQVYLPEPESSKELTGVQYACTEENHSLRPDLIFADFADVIARSGSLRTDPEAIIMPQGDDVEAVQAIKALGGAKLERVIIGDDSLLDKPRRPAVVVFRRDELMELAATEIMRLSGDNRIGNHNFVLETELHEP